MRIAVLCSGLGNVVRGHETFIRQVFDALESSLDMTLFKGGGEPKANEIVVDHVPRYSKLLDGMHVVAPPKWRSAAQEEQRFQVEMRTFAHASLAHLLAGGFDVIHCLEREVAEIVYQHRLLFANPPKVLFSNGGALPRKRLPPCDFVQEHTAYSMARGAPEKSFLIPHGIDLRRFDPSILSDFRARLGVPENALLVLSVGAICHSHKRMDHLIEEVAGVDGAWLVVVGQEAIDSPAIKALGERLMGERVRFLQLPHEQLPQAYRAADVFALASLFETFGIVYLEAMAMGLPVIATEHENQRQILGDAVFVDMQRRGALREAILRLDPQARRRLGDLGRKRVETHYDLAKLRQDYVDMYQRIAATTITPARHTLSRRIVANLRNLLR